MKPKPKSCVVVCCLSLLACAAARADEPEPVRELTAGKNLYQEARFSEAISSLQEAVRELEPQSGVDAGKSQLVDAYVHLGLSYFALRETATAKDAFKNALRLDPSRRLDAEVYAPKVVDLFEQARLAVTGSAPLVPPAPAAILPPPAPQTRFTLVLAQDQALFAPREAPRRASIPAGSSLTPVPFRFQPQSYTPAFEVTARVPLQLGRLGVAYRKVDASNGSRYSGFQVNEPEGVQRTERLTSDQGVIVKTLDITWSGLHLHSGPLRVRRELGYRQIRTEETLHQIYRDHRSGTLVYEAEHESYAAQLIHGLRLGAAADISLGGRWHLDLNVGLTTVITETESGGVISDEVRRPDGVSSRLPSSPYERTSHGGTRWDLAARLRKDLWKGLSIIGGYRMERQPSSYFDFDSNLNYRGATLAIGYRLDR